MDRGPQTDVDLLDGSEKAGEGGTEVLREAAVLPEIAVAELVGSGDYSRAHGTVFVGSASPCLGVFFVDPQGEAHTSIMRQRKMPRRRAP